MKVLLRLLSLLLPLIAARAEPPIKPDPQLTPGAVLEVTKEDLCTPGYTKKVRDVLFAEDVVKVWERHRF